VVFKLIRDRFAIPKKATRQEVMEKYDLVFKHDRAGRLVDAQVFEHLKFDECCFAPELLIELQREAGQTVRIADSSVIVDHAYIERRVTPLNIYLEEAGEDAACKAVIDLGRAIKDLAVSNIFPGDILLKNFGVTRRGRVVFYDYDEVCPLTNCKFRKLPQSSSYEDELASEPWFHVDENDVFPEEFSKFLWLPESLREVFVKHHSDLFEVDFWRRTQTAIEAGELTHIYPYERSAGQEAKHAFYLSGCIDDEEKKS
jgi:isocitrate dehydrogenase kinase/phosphatase